MEIRRLGKVLIYPRDALYFGGEGGGGGPVDYVVCLFYVDEVEVVEVVVEFGE